MITPNCPNCNRSRYVKDRCVECDSLYYRELIHELSIPKLSLMIIAWCVAAFVSGIIFEMLVKL